MKKRKKFARGLGYLLSAIVVVFGTYLIVLLASGHSLDIFSGKIKATGLLKLDSDPDGGTISVNGKVLKNKTPAQVTNIDPGEVGVSMSKDGFRTWHVQAKIIAGQVTFLDYALFLPNTITTTELLNNLNITSSSQSRDRKKTLVVTAAPNPIVYATDNLVDATNIYQPTATNPIISDISVATISEDNNAAVVAQKRGPNTDFIYIDTKGSRTPQNLTQEYHVTTNQFGFNPDNSNELLWLDGVNLRIIDVSARTVSNPVATNVVYFTTANKKLYYISGDATTRSLFSADFGGNRKITVLSNIDISPNYKLAAAKFNGGDYFALLVNKNNRLSIYRDNGEDGAKTGGVLEHVTDMIFNRTGRYLAINQAGLLTTYDVERKEYLGGATSLADTVFWQWYDDHHLVVNNKTTLRLIDFDGQNDQPIANLDPKNIWLAPAIVFNKNIVQLHKNLPAKNQLTQYVLVEKNLIK